MMLVIIRLRRKGREQIFLIFFGWIFIYFIEVFLQCFDQYFFYMLVSGSSLLILQKVFSQLARQSQPTMHSQPNQPPTTPPQTHVQPLKNYQMITQLQQRILTIKIIHQTHKQFIFYNRFAYEQLPASMKVLFWSIEEFYKELTMGGDQMFELTESGLLKYIIPLKSKYFTFDIELQKMEYTQVQAQKIQIQILKSHILKLNETISQQNTQLAANQQLITTLQHHKQKTQNNQPQKPRDTQVSETKKIDYPPKEVLIDQKKDHDLSKDTQKSRSQQNSGMDIENSYNHDKTRSRDEGISRVQDGESRVQKIKDFKKLFQKEGNQNKKKNIEDPQQKGKERQKGKALWSYKPQGKTISEPLRRKIQFQPSEMISFFIDQQHPNHSHFTFLNNRLKYISTVSNTLHMIPSREAAKIKDNHIFGVKMVKIPSKTMIFGLTARQNLGWLEMVSSKSTFVVIKGTSISLYLEGSEKQSISNLKVNDEVHISVNLMSKSLQWYLNHELQFVCSMQNSQVLNCNGLMYGFICMGGQNDEIQLL